MKIDENNFDDFEVAAAVVCGVCLTKQTLFRGFSIFLRSVTATRTAPGGARQSRMRTDVSRKKMMKWKVVHLNY